MKSMLFALLLILSVNVPQAEAQCRLFERHTCIRKFDFAGSFQRQRQSTEQLQASMNTLIETDRARFGAQRKAAQQLQGSMNQLMEANRLANADRERLMDRLSEDRRERKVFERELASFRAERSGLLEQIRLNREERKIANAKARAEREKQMIELAKAERERQGLMAKLGIAQQDNSRLFARQRGEFAPLKNMMQRLTMFVVWIMIFSRNLCCMFPTRCLPLEQSQI